MEPPYLPDIIDECVALLPEDDPLDMRSAMLDIKSSAGFAPPWGQQLWWQQFFELCQGKIPFPPVEQWQRKIYKIVTQKDPPTIVESSGSIAQQEQITP